MPEIPEISLPKTPILAYFRYYRHIAVLGRPAGLSNFGKAVRARQELPKLKWLGRRN